MWLTEGDGTELSVHRLFDEWEDALDIGTAVALCEESGLSPLSEEAEDGVEAGGGNEVGLVEYDKSALGGDEGIQLGIARGEGQLRRRGQGRAVYEAMTGGGRDEGGGGG